MPLRRLPLCVVAFCVVCASLLAQEPSKSVTSAEDYDLSAVVKETQQSANEPGYIAMVWWMPTEYWEIATEGNGVSVEKAKERFAPLRRYTVLAVVVGKIGIGNVNYIPEAEIRDATTLRDADGNVYQPLQKLTGDAEGLASIIKPVFSNMMGQMGQNIQLLFFAGTNKMAKPIADPRTTGSFSVTVAKIIGGKDKVIEWRLPLTSLSPPKYCPIGKERVQANWKYCPWHGVKLDELVPPGAPVN
jgi:hypothetical protein